MRALGLFASQEQHFHKDKPSHGTLQVVLQHLSIVSATRKGKEAQRLQRNKMESSEAAKHPMHLTKRFLMPRGGFSGIRQQAYQNTDKR